MALEGLADVVALEVVGWVAGDGDIVVVDEQFDVEVLCDGEAGGFGVVALLLAAVGAKHEDRLVGVGHGDAVDEGPHMPESARGELHAGRVAAFGVAGQVLVELAVAVEFFDGQLAFEDGEEVLRRDAVTGLVEEDGQDIGCVAGLGVFNERADDDDFGDGVVRAAGVTRQAAGTGVGGEERDRITAELDVVLERIALLVGQLGVGRVEGDVLVRIEVDGEGSGGHGWAWGLRSRVIVVGKFNGSWATRSREDRVTWFRGSHRRGLLNLMVRNPQRAPERASHGLRSE